MKPWFRIYVRTLRPECLTPERPTRLDVLVAFALGLVVGVVYVSAVGSPF